MNGGQKKGRPKPAQLSPISSGRKLCAAGNFLVLPASRKPITASTTKQDYKDDDDNYCLDTHVSVSSCLVGVSHTPFDGLELPSGITKNGRKGHRRSLCPSFRGTTELRPVSLAKYLAFLDQAIEATGDSLICYSTGGGATATASNLAGAPTSAVAIATRSFVPGRR
jgi:hypothetical protein